MSNRLRIFVSESATAGPEGSDLGELYWEPFTPQLGMWAFSARVVEALCSHAWQPSQSTNELWLVHPWQGGWEAMLFLTRVVSRIALDGRIGAWHGAIRPIVRLAR